MKRLVESLVKPFINESKKRVPRKKGQHRGSKSHSDLYTDENPKGTIKGLKFATVKDAEASVRKIKSSGRSHAHKIQAAVAMEQRAREMGKKSQAAVYRSYINKMKKKTKKKNEDINIPVEIGDTILTGRFKNKKVVVKSIEKDEHGMPTINGKKITTFRVLKNKTNQKNESSITSNIKGVKGYSPFVEDGQFDDYVAHLKKIFEKNGEKFILKEGVNDPGILKAVFLAGGPGSGKTYITRGLFGIPKSITLSAFGLKVVNSDTELERMLNKYGFGTDLDAMPDEIFRQLTDPSYEDYSGLRTRAKELTQARRKLYTDGRLGMIIDGTGRKFKEISKQKNELEKIGYDTYMVFVHTKLEIAQKRNMARARKLSPELVEKSWNDVQANKGAFQGLFGSSNFLLVDNSQTLAEKAAEKKFQMLVRKGVGKFIKKPVKNYRGQNWVKKQKLLKKEVIQKVKEMMNYPNLLRPVAQVPAIQKDGEHRYYNPDTTKKKKKKKENTSVPYGSGYEKIKEQKEIKKIVGVYGGRFQPFGPHHKKTYEWLKKKVDDAYITTSNIKQPPRHPMNFKEKVRHMTKMGVPKNRIVQEKSPYVAKNVLSKYDPQTTAVVYIFGAKDAGRLKGGKYFQDYKKSKDNLNGFEDNGYVLTAPHVSINIAGKEVSGTTMRQLLGSPDMEKDREKLFKKAFGYFDKGIYNMMTNKFKKLFEQFKLTNEIIDEFLTEIDVNKIIKESTTGGSPTDDGPPTFYRGFNDYKKNVTNWIDDMYAGAGWKILNYILGKGALNPDYDYTLEYNVVPAVAYGRKQSGEYGTRFGVDNPIQSYKNYIEGTVLKNLGYTLLKWIGITPDGNSYTGVEVETPVLPGVGVDNVGNTTKDKLKLKERINLNKEIKLLFEGGAYGHMNHPFDDKDLTFGDLKKIVDLGLQGRLDLEESPTEKTDGQNLMITFKKDKLLAARNKGQIKDKGKKAMDVVAVARKFQGRGDIKDAFVFAMQDLKKMVGKLSDAQKKKIFDEGGNFVNLEIIYPPTKNIIDYDKRLLQFHGATKYDENGNPKGQVRDGGRILAGMITQINANIGKKFKVQKPNFLTLKKSQNFGKKRDIYFNRIDKLKSQFGLKDTDTLNEYHQSYWMEFIFNAAKQYKYAIPNKVLMNLTKRWAFFDKSYSVQKIRADIDNQKFLDWFLSTDKQDHTKMVKENMKPFEILFFELGAEILKNISNFLAANPDKAVQTIRKDVVKAINVVRKGKDLKKLNTLKQQLSKLNAIGGFKSIVPAEGLVFKYKGKTYKFTGAFAPINQIIGLTTF
jgi:hypothetical protein